MAAAAEILHCELVRRAQYIYYPSCKTVRAPSLNSLKKEIQAPWLGGTQVYNAWRLLLLLLLIELTMKKVHSS